LGGVLCGKGNDLLHSFDVKKAAARGGENAGHTAGKFFIGTGAKNTLLFFAPVLSGNF
jgi:hypothetical protein